MISIIMPVKNPGRFLEPCLESILAQSYSNWELIAIDDGSTDRSFGVLKRYAQSHANIRYIRSNGVGIIAALQTGYTLCSGDLIHRMDADDIMPPEKLEKMKSAWQPGSVVTGHVRYFSEDYPLGEGYKNYENWLNDQMSTNAIWQDIYKECPLPSSAWLMNRSDFEQIGGFQSDHIPEDYDLAFRVYQSKLKVRIVPEIVHLWRDSNSRTSRIEKAYFPHNYTNLKVHYFLKIDRNNHKPLLVWGAGKKGKKVAQCLLKKEVPFVWVTNNPKKIKTNIYGQPLLDCWSVVMEDYQSILAVSSPQDRVQIQEILATKKLNSTKDYCWFF